MFLLLQLIAQRVHVLTGCLWAVAAVWSVWPSLCVLVFLFLPSHGYFFGVSVLHFVFYCFCVFLYTSSNKQAASTYQSNLSSIHHHLSFTMQSQTNASGPELRGSNITIKRITAASDVTTRKTLIICTMGLACWEVPTLEQLIHASMNVARFNFSNGDHEGHKACWLRIRMPTMVS